MLNFSKFINYNYNVQCTIRMRLNLDKHLRMKISDKSLTQRFDVAMT